MNDHESTRAAFERPHHPAMRARKENGQYYSEYMRGEWDAWCRALDYAAQQQLSSPEGQRAPCPEASDNGDALAGPPSGGDVHHAPAPLPQPDKPGWWWNWNPHRQEWRCWTVSKPNHEDDGLWLPATPPPAPNVKDEPRGGL